MMTLVSLSPQKGHLFKVTFSSGEEILLDRDTVTNQNVAVGKEYDAKDIKSLVSESEYTRAKSRGLWFLDRSDRSERVLFEKIVSGGIGEEAAARAVARFKELGLVDDRRYAANIAQSLLGANYSKREVFAKLMQRRVPTDIIKEVLSEAEVDEVSQIKAVIEKKYKNRLKDKNDTQKVVAALMRKGFSYGSVRTALQEYNLELEYED